MSANPLRNRAIIRIAPTEVGEDVRGFLQGLVTNDVSGDLPAYAALLSAQGKTMFDFLVWDDGEALLLDCEADSAKDLVKRLSLYRLRRQISIAIEPELGAMWSPETFDGAVCDPRHAGLGFRQLAPTSSTGPSADQDYLLNRLRLGIAEGQAELGDILWLETNAIELNGVSFEKGCYIGQENTARMNWRQKVNRRLVVVSIDQSNEKRQKMAYPALGFAIDHLRVNDIDPVTLPEWQAHAIQSVD